MSNTWQMLDENAWSPTTKDIGDRKMAALVPLKWDALFSKHVELHSCRAQRKLIWGSNSCFSLLHETLVIWSHPTMLWVNKKVAPLVRSWISISQRVIKNRLLKAPQNVAPLCMCSGSEQHGTAGRWLWPRRGTPGRWLYPRGWWCTGRISSSRKENHCWPHSRTEIHLQPQKERREHLIHTWTGRRVPGLLSPTVKIIWMSSRKLWKTQ